MRELVAGDTVRLTAEAKRLMTGNRHTLLDSAEHVDEFGDCVGVIEGLLDGRGPELKVRWRPSGLAYGYPPDHLELAP